MAVLWKREDYFIIIIRQIMAGDDIGGFMRALESTNLKDSEAIIGLQKPSKTGDQKHFRKTQIPNSLVFSLHSRRLYHQLQK